MINRTYFNNLIEHIFESRITRNIVFWLFFGILYFINHYTYEGSKLFESLTLYQVAIILFSRVLVYGPVVYFNNLVLLPLFLEKRKYILYLISVSGLIFAGIHYVKVTVMWFTAQIPQLIKDQEEVVTASAFLFATTSILLGFTMSKYAADYFINKQKEQTLQKENLLSELDVLKSQINPHFLFNALNTIYGLSIANNSNTSQAVMQLSDILRYNLYECNSEKVPLEKEISFIENYLEFAKLRRNNTKRIEYSKEGDFSNLFIAPLLFIPFIENSFKHGLDKNIENSWVSIKIKTDENFIIFICANSNKKTTPNTSNINSGIGLSNVKRRLELLYPKKYQLSIKEKDDFYSTILKIEKR